eukprot:TRINITY_DN1618_c0_g2_i1.p1 TRINITY_DN1618_c0_g2~~TRINITY_DN1618_c0_g2_i1.p1  ORF type:complete len:250 (+),score=50.32 TRINITY_DN1618_c0_g2_i1:44-793(+)
MRLLYSVLLVLLAVQCSYSNDLCTHIKSSDGYTYNLEWFIKAGPYGPVKGIKPPQSYNYKFTICGSGFICGKQVCGAGKAGSCQSWSSNPFNNDHTDEACTGMDTPTQVVGLNGGLGAQFFYGNGDEFSGVPRTTTIYMICGKEDGWGQVIFNDTLTDDLKYSVVVTSKYACGSKGGGVSGISPAGVIVLIIFCVIIVYLVAGVIVNKVRGQSGVELIPNVGLWKNIGGLIRDGSCCIVRRGGGTYGSV